MNDEKSTSRQYGSKPVESAPETTQAESPPSTSDDFDDNFIVGEESEPYLGASWAVLMLVLYVLKSLFPAETFSMLWWFQMYILLIVFGVTIFTLLKRYRYSKLHPLEKEFPVKELRDESPDKK